jgi:hypothetical protein
MAVLTARDRATEHVAEDGLLVFAHGVDEDGHGDSG